MHFASNADIVLSGLSMQHIFGLLAGRMGVARFFGSHWPVKSVSPLSPSSIGVESGYAYKPFRHLNLEWC